MELPEVLVIGLFAPSPVLKLVAGAQRRQLTLDGKAFSAIDDGRESPGFYDWLRDESMQVRGVRWDMDVHNAFVGSVARELELSYVSVQNNCYDIGFGVSPTELHTLVPERTMGSWLYRADDGAYADF